MRTKTLISVCLCSLLLLSGCWDNIDIGKQNYAMTIILDGHIGNVNGIVQCSDPTASEASADNSDLLEIKGVGINISDFLGVAEGESDKLVTYEHLQLILLAPEFFKNNTLECIQYFMSRAEIQKTADIVITDSNIEEMISTTVNNKAFYKHVGGMLSSDTVSSSSVLLDSSLIAISRLQKDGHPFRINRINFDPKTKDIFSDGFGVFADGKFCGFIDRQRAPFIRWFGMKSSNFYVSCIMEGEKNPVGFRCISSSSHISAIKNGDSFQLSVKINADFRLNEYDMKDSAEPFSSEFYKRAEAAVTTAVSNQCCQIIDLAQKELKTDFLGFSRAVENEYPDWWEENNPEWNTFFSSATIEYEADCSLVTTGDLK